MDVIRIKGGRPLKGCVDVAGSKNAALPLMAATLLTDQPCTLSNVPDLSDTRYMAQILGHLGALVERLDVHTWRITAQRITAAAPYDLVSKMRAAVCLMGPLVGRLRRADVSLPGGCIIGPRPIDLHLKGFAGVFSLDCGAIDNSIKIPAHDPIFGLSKHKDLQTGAQSRQKSRNSAILTGMAIASDDRDRPTSFVGGAQNGSGQHSVPQTLNGYHLR